MEAFPPPTPPMSTKVTARPATTSLRSVFSLRRLQKGWKKSEALVDEWMADIERDGSVLKKKPTHRQRYPSSSQQVEELGAMESKLRSVLSSQEEMAIPGGWRLSWETERSGALDPEFANAVRRYAEELGPRKGRDQVLEEAETAQHVALDREWWEVVRQNRHRREQPDPMERWMYETQLAQAISILGERDLHAVQERAGLDIWLEDDLQTASTTNRAREDIRSGQLVNDQRTQARNRDCIVCGDAKDALRFPAKPPTASCQHEPQTCSECLAHWISSEVDMKGTGNIRCSECPAQLTHTDVQRAASPNTFATYDKCATREALGSLPNFVWCLSSTCAAGQENIPDANFMECMSCGYRQCLSHRIPWHEEETCETYKYRISGQQARDEKQKQRDEKQRRKTEERKRQDEEQARENEKRRRREQEKRDEENMTEAMIGKVSKKCPNPKGCGQRMEKIDGCDHITCQRCRWEFCWLCLASYKDIRSKGNRAHLTSCSHYA